jgi:hypothetical protein
VLPIVNPKPAPDPPTLALPKQASTPAAASPGATMDGACRVEWRDETVVLMTVGDAVAVLRFVFRICDRGGSVSTTIPVANLCLRGSTAQDEQCDCRFQPKFRHKTLPDMTRKGCTF